MVLVEEAEKIILQQARQFGTERRPFDECLGRVLAEDISADRDLPPYDRVTMDGIAISYEAFEKGIRSFQIKAVQSAGEPPVDIKAMDECIEIMTGAVLPSTTDTIIPYEELDLKNGIAVITSGNPVKNQNIHWKGKDKKRDEVVVPANRLITPAVMTIAATTGKTSLLVKKFPTIIIISTGDELVDIGDAPTSFQVRRSNNYTIRSVLQQNGLQAHMIHLPDDPDIIFNTMQECLENYDVILLSGGVSMGKFDYIPPALDKLGVKRLFYKVQQRPGKPFWFGAHEKGPLFFALPGNPVSTFMCFHRYFMRWLKASLQIETREAYAMLDRAFTFSPLLQYFLQVKLTFNKNGELMATPLEGNGSGDFANLLQTDAFLELPLERSEFKKGEVFRVWPFNNIL